MSCKTGTPIKRAPSFAILPVIFPLPETARRSPEDISSEILPDMATSPRQNP